MYRINERQIFYLLLIIAAGFFLHMANSIPSGMGVSSDPGAGFLPYWVSVLIMLLVGYLLVTETVLDKSHGAAAGFSRSEAIALAATLASIVAYLVLLSLIGFLASTLLFLLVFRQIADRLIRGASPTLRSLGASAVFSLLVTGFVYLVFAVLFKLSLP